LTVFACVCGERLSDPRLIVAVMTFGRTLIIVFDDQYYLIGHR
jgi:hypothetical protein